MIKKTDISQIRFRYKKDKLSKKLSSSNPFKQFNKWLNEAIKNKVFEPTAMSLATLKKKKVSHFFALRNFTNFNYAELSKNKKYLKNRLILSRTFHIHIELYIIALFIINFFCLNFLNFFKKNNNKNIFISNFYKFNMMKKHVKLFIKTIRIGHFYNTGRNILICKVLSSGQFGKINSTIFDVLKETPSQK